jgi:hypothetical protein
MTKTKKTKLLIYNAMFSIGVIAVFIYLNSITINMTAKEMDDFIETHKQQEIARLTSSANAQDTQVNTIEQIAPLFKQVPEPVLIELYQQLSEQELYMTLEFIKILEPSQINYLANLFSHLNASAIKRLIYITNKLGEERTIILVNTLLELSPSHQTLLIDILVSIPLSRTTALVYLLNDINPSTLPILIEVVANSKQPKNVVDLILKIPSSNFKDFLTAFLSLPINTIDVFTDMAENLQLNDLINAIELFIKLNDSYRIRLLTLLEKTDMSERVTVLKHFLNISTAHTERAIDLIEQDERLLHKGTYLAQRLDKHLTQQGSFDTIERSINTASRVSYTHRIDGLEIISGNVRDVAARRILKQVDGQKYIYNDDTVEQLVDDFNTVNNKSNFINILSGSDGIIHGPYRSSQKVVTQERKLHVIQRFYQGDLVDKKKEALKFYNRNTVTVPKTNETNFIIEEPVILKEKDQF